MKDFFPNLKERFRGLIQFARWVQCGNCENGNKLSNRRFY